MSLRAVRFKPRPVHPECGTEWMPTGLEYRPYHPGFEQDAVWDGMDERKFKCSPSLQRYLDEYYREIKGLMIDLPPLDNVPPVEDSADLCVIATRFRSATDSAKMLEFQERVLEQLRACLAALPQEALDEVPLPTLPGEDLVDKVMEADMHSMRSELIELKVWVSMYTEFHGYLLRRMAFIQELRRRHPAKHGCLLPLSMLTEELRHTFGRFFSQFRSKTVHRDDAVTSNIETADETLSTSDVDVSPASGTTMRRRP
ncbi:hypothetical protein B0H16DRAFT_1708073 [Mycena metata]|uniref:Uncharacterized protein n=1 Tax=Mycena metata TaxID=1033252 RepID=A0AAD7P2F5_9AGAR|nr:hypothetical protein B0H16DRAFT_1708073 [Mycena metata]